MNTKSIVIIDYGVFDPCLEIYAKDSPDSSYEQRIFYIMSLTENDVVHNLSNTRSSYLPKKKIA